MNRDDGLRGQRGAVRDRRQIVEQTAGYRSVLVKRGEAVDLGQQRRPPDEPAVVQRLQQCALGRTGGCPAVQRAQPPDRARRKQLRGR
jgi:hypothetical protein